VLAFIPVQGHICLNHVHTMEQFSKRDFIQAERSSLSAVLPLLNFQLKGMDVPFHRQDRHAGLYFDVTVISQQTSALRI
jgi:hypothetical protein